MDQHGYSWDDAWQITGRTLAYTNHTVMSEALEKWSISLFSGRLPRIFTIVKEINRRFCERIYEEHPEKRGVIDQMAVIGEGMVRMANLCVACCFSVNGVSALHSEILKKDLFKDYNDIFPGRLTNVTNGIVHRRWLCESNPWLTAMIPVSYTHLGWIAAHGFFAYGHRMRNGYPWWGISAAGTFPPFR